MSGFSIEALKRLTPIGDPSSVTLNTVEDYFSRFGKVWEGSVNITGNNETLNLNVFQFTGTVLILNQWAVITDTTALTNCTNVYADIYDGTTATDLTADGIDLSGVSAGSFFTKDKVTTQTYTLLKSDQARVNETLEDKRVGRPFTVTAKNGATNYIRFNLTTNTTLDFTMFLHFEYLLLNGATLTQV